jgi:hypothetical protein
MVPSGFHYEGNRSLSRRGDYDGDRAGMDAELAAKIRWLAGQVFWYVR